MSRFPPKDAKCKPDTSGLGSVVFPSSTLASSEIWDESIRDALAKPRYKKKDLDERRSKVIVSHGLLWSGLLTSPYILRTSSLELH